MILPSAQTKGTPGSLIDQIEDADRPAVLDPARVPAKGLDGLDELALTIGFVHCSRPLLDRRNRH